MTIAHWTPQRKAALIRAVRSGELVCEAILVEHWISPEEYAAWERDYDSAGVPGVRSTRYQIYRGRSAGQRPRGRPRGKALAAVIATALVAGFSTGAAAQTYYHTESPFQSYLPRPRYDAPTYIPQQNDPPQFNPPARQPSIGDLPSFGNYCWGLGGQIRTNCN